MVPLHGFKQIILLLSNLLGFHVILVRSLNQGHGLLFSLSSMPTGVHLPNSKVGHLSDGRGELDDFLLSGSELHC
jgi:hypothetical protein